MNILKKLNLIEVPVTPVPIPVKIVRIKLLNVKPVYKDPLGKILVIVLAKKVYLLLFLS